MSFWCRLGFHDWKLVWEAKEHDVMQCKYCGRRERWMRPIDRDFFPMPPIG